VAEADRSKFNLTGGHNAVLHREVIEIGDLKAGYLVFKTFIEPAEAELDAGWRTPAYQ
jgi:hypothetical protein